MKKVLSLFLSLVIISCSLTAVPFSVMADDVIGDIGYIENPVYATEMANKLYSYRLASASQTDILSRAEFVRDKMVAREKNINISFTSDSVIWSSRTLANLITDLFMKATSDELSVSCVDGDYIRYQWGGVDTLSGDTQENSDGTYKYTLNFEVNYYDTISQEHKVDKIIENYLSKIDFSSYSDYEILQKFHDYILNSCDYDNDYAKRTDNYNFSAYGALSLGRAVCQGYSLAFYRLCKEAGFEARVVTSDPDIGCHAWNLVNIAGNCYYVDCTWDDDLYNKYDLFLVNYKTIQMYDNGSYAHMLEDDYLYDSHFQDNYGKYISEESWDAQSKNLGNCIVSADYSKITDIDGVVLESGKDYTYSTANSSYDIVITGAGDYKSSVLKKKKLIYQMNSALSYTSTTFSNKEKKPSATVDNLKFGKDFTVYYFNNTNAGTAYALIIAKGKYAGFASKEFKINKDTISNKKITLSKTSYAYDGCEKKPAVTIDGLKKGSDYKVSYSSNKNIGKAKVVITGIGNYSGSATKTFSIIPATVTSFKGSTKATSITLTWKKVEKASGYYIERYSSGKWKKVATVSSDKKATYTVTKLSSSTSYKFRIRAYKVVNDSKIYSKAKTLTVYTKPKKTSIKSLSTSKNSITVKWNKTKSSGYQIEYSLYPDFKNSKKVNVSGESKISKKISSLKKGKKYYIRVRAYKTVNEKKSYGEWSPKKSITCK